MFEVIGIASVSVAFEGGGRRVVDVSVGMEGGSGGGGKEVDVGVRVRAENAGGRRLLCLRVRAITRLIKQRDSA